jgi:uncharacterized protein YxjI
MNQQYGYTRPQETVNPYEDQQQYYQAPGAVVEKTITQQTYYEQPQPYVQQSAYQQTQYYNDFDYMGNEQYVEQQPPNISVDFYQQAPSYTIVRRNSFSETDRSMGSRPSTMESSFYKKGPHFRVDSFFDTIPVNPHANDPVGDLDDFFAEFEKKATIRAKSPIPERKEAVAKSRDILLQENLARLRGLGFDEEERNIQLLKAYEGDVDKVIRHLIDIERLRVQVNEKKLTKSPKSPIGAKGVIVTPKSTLRASEQRFTIKVGDLKNLTYTIAIEDDKGAPAYKAVLLLHSCIILKDKNNNTISRVVKEDIHLHPTYSVSRNGRKLATCKERFKLSLERKFNYHMFTGDVIKMNGSYGKDWVFRKGGVVIGTLTEKKKKHYEITTKSQLIPHIITLAMIMLERRATSMRAVVLV